MSIFTKDIDRQVERYVEHKAKRSSYQAERDRQWIEKFCQVTKCRDIFVATEKLDEFKNYLNKEYGPTFCYRDALHSLQGFLKFYRCIKWNDVI